MNKNNRRDGRNDTKSFFPIMVITILGVLLISLLIVAGKLQHQVNNIVADKTTPVDTPVDLTISESTIVDEENRRKLLTVSYEGNKNDLYYEYAESMAQALVDADFDTLINNLAINELEKRDFKIVDEEVLMDKLVQLSSKLSEYDYFYSSYAQKEQEYCYVAVYFLNENTSSTDGAFDYDSLKSVNFTVFETEKGYTMLPFLLNNLYFDAGSYGIEAGENNIVAKKENTKLNITYDLSEEECIEVANMLFDGSVDNHNDCNEDHLEGNITTFKCQICGIDEECLDIKEKIICSRCAEITKRCQYCGYH